jgi:hypothetical protein
MTLPKSHKSPAIAHAEHQQSRQHAPTGKAAYGEDTSNHPSRKVDPEQVRSMFQGLGFMPTRADPFG